MVLTDVTTHTIQHFLPPNAVTIVAELLEATKDFALKEQLIMVLANIAGESLAYRDEVLGSGMLKTLLMFINHPCASLNMLRNGSWALSQLCYGRDPVPDVAKISLCIPPLVALAQHEDCGIISDSCWALGHLMDGHKKHIQTVVESGICPRLIQLLSYEFSEKVTPAVLHAVGQITLGSDSQVQVIINCDPSFKALRELLSSGDQETVKNSCWIISNIAAGNMCQIQSLIDSNIMPMILNLLVNSSTEVQLEAAWIINLSVSTNRTSRNQLEYFVSIGCIFALCIAMRSNDVTILQVVLKTIRNILRFGDAHNLNEIEEICGKLN